MATRVEHLPVELWITIFSYLEVHDLYRAFTDLNNYFNKILASDYLLFYIRFQRHDDDKNLLSTKLFGSNEIFNRITCLQWFIHSHREFIPKVIHLNIDKMIRLRSMIIPVSSRNMSLFCDLLSKLNSIEYLSINCSMTQTLFETILSTSSLRILKLDCSDSETIIDFSMKTESNIEAFYAELDRNTSIITKFLAHLPKLRRFEICGTLGVDNDMNVFFANDIFLRQKLQTIKIEWAPNPFCLPTITFFEHLRSISFNVKRFYILIHHDEGDIMLLENLIYHWWNILEQIKNIYMTIRSYHFRDLIAFNLTYRDKYRQVLLAKNKQPNRYFKIDWIDAKDEYGSPYVDINIRKL